MMITPLLVWPCFRTETHGAHVRDGRTVSHRDVQHRSNNKKMTSTVRWTLFELPIRWELTMKRFLGCNTFIRAYYDYEKKFLSIGLIGQHDNL